MPNSLLQHHTDLPILQSTQAAHTLLHPPVILRLDYCSLLLAGSPLSMVRPPQPIQNAATQLVSKLPNFSYTTLLLCSLHRLLVAAHTEL